MGFFSFKTADTDRSIPNIHSNKKTFTVHVLIPKEFGGGYITEEQYQGYGIFGGKDIYELLFEFNFPGILGIPGEKKREKAIDLYFENKLKYVPKIVENKYLSYEQVGESKRDENQGYFYD